MGSRNRQRPTFEKRQREIARQERQAEKRARRRDRAAGIEDGSYEPNAPFDPDAPPFDPNAPALEDATPVDGDAAVPDQPLTPGIS